MLPQRIPITARLKKKLVKARNKLKPHPYLENVLNFKTAQQSLVRCSNYFEKKDFIDHFHELEIAVFSIMAYTFKHFNEKRVSEEKIKEEGFNKRIQFLRLQLLQLLEEEGKPAINIDLVTYDAIYNCLLTLAAYWPKDNKHQCSISGIPIQNRNKDVVLFCTGHSCHKSILKNWLSEHHGFIVVDNDNVNDSTGRGNLLIGERDKCQILARVSELDLVTRQKLALVLNPVSLNKIKQAEERGGKIGRKMGKGITAFVILVYIASILFIASLDTVFSLAISTYSICMLNGLFSDLSGNGFWKGVFWGGVLSTVGSLSIGFIGVIGSLIFSNILAIFSSYSTPLYIGDIVNMGYRLAGHTTHLSVYSYLALDIFYISHLALFFLTGAYLVKCFINRLLGDPIVFDHFSNLSKDTWSVVAAIPSKIGECLGKKIGKRLEENKYTLEARTTIGQRSLGIYNAISLKEFSSSASMRQCLTQNNENTMVESKTISFIPQPISPASSPRPLPSSSPKRYVVKNDITQSNGEIISEISFSGLSLLRSN